MDFTIVVPTYNEEEGIASLMSLIQQAMNGATFSWEVVVVDDSRDKTAEILRSLHYPWLHIDQREPSRRNGLSGAIIDGMRISSARWIICMDSDGQHPPKDVRQMMELVLSVEYNTDVIMATRYAQGGSTTGLDGFFRHLASSSLRWLPRVLFARKMWWVSDSLGGFFAVRRQVLRFERMRAIGWKISLEVLLMSEYGKSLMMPYTFQHRLAGESKANAKVALDYLRQVISLFWRYYIWRR